MEFSSVHDVGRAWIFHVSCAVPARGLSVGAIPIDPGKIRSEGGPGKTGEGRRDFPLMYPHLLEFRPTGTRQSWSCPCRVQGVLMLGFSKSNIVCRKVVATIKLCAFSHRNKTHRDCIYLPASVINNKCHNLIFRWINALCDRKKPAQKPAGRGYFGRSRGKEGTRHRFNTACDERGIERRRCGSTHPLGSPSCRRGAYGCRLCPARRVLTRG